MLVALGALEFGASAPALAWCQMTSSPRAAPAGSCQEEGFPLTWHQRCLEYAIDSRGSDDIPIERVREIIATSFEAWTRLECDGNAAGFEVREHADLAHCNLAEYNQDTGNVNTITFVDDWRARRYDPAAYALTTVWHNTRTGEIYDVDMEINEARGPYGVCPPRTGCADGSMVDLQNVVTHEAGHFFGLGHSGVDFATMNAVSPPGEVSKRILRTDDTEGFCTIYPADSLPAECSFAPRGGLDLYCGGEKPADDCGCTAPGMPTGRGLRWAWAFGLALLLGVARRR